MIKRLYWFGAADGRLVVKATMRTGVVVVVGPGSEAEVSLLGVGPVSGVVLSPNVLILMYVYKSNHKVFHAKHFCRMVAFDFRFAFDFSIKD
jgi:hypothetical protein